MSNYYVVKDVVCDYGVYYCDSEKRTHDLIEICNSKHNAELICKILNADLQHKVYKPKEKDMTSLVLLGVKVRILMFLLDLKILIFQTLVAELHLVVFRISFLQYSAI